MVLSDGGVRRLAMSPRMIGHKVRERQVG